MQIRFWGTRGSLPSPLKAEQMEEKICQAIFGLPNIPPRDMEAIRAYVRRLPPLARGTAGGNTPCVEIQAEGETLIVDAGSGLRELGLELMKGPCGRGQGCLHLFISHLHWDHIQGFPFFVPAHIPGNRIFIYGAHDLEAAFKDQQRPLNFPISLPQMQAQIKFISLRVEQPITLGRIRVSACLNTHPGGSYSYRIEDTYSACVYASDVEYKQLDDTSVLPHIAFFRNADALIFDAQYTLKESWQKMDWGHSSALIGVDLARAANVKRLILFHHDPIYSDNDLQEILLAALDFQAQDTSKPTCEVIIAYEGLTLDLTPPGSVSLQLVPNGESAIWTPTHTFDEHGADQLAQQLACLSDPHTNSIIDMSQVKTLTTASLKSLVTLHQGNHIVLAAPSDAVQHVIALANYQDYFAIYPSVQAALTAVQTREALNLPGQVIHNRYQIESKLGEGRLGVMLKATEIQSHRAVALKLLLPSFSPETLARFSRQSQPIIQLEHHNIVKVLAWEQINSHALIVEEFVSGQVLQHYLEENGVLSTSQVIDIAVDIARALEYAHSRGVIHSNLKPHNIFLKDGKVKLNGWGLGRLEEGRNLLESPRLFLAPAYLAPEQILGQPLDARTDLYALGLILYQLLTGRLPFEGSDQQVLQAHLRHSPCPLRHLNPHIAPSLEHLVLKLLAKNPNDRYASAQQARRISSSLIVRTEEVTSSRHCPLVGREEPVQILQTCWQAAQAGRGQLAFITGEPGIGKTRLAQHIAALCATPVRLIGHCHESKGNHPYHLFSQVIADYFATVPPEFFDDQARQTIACFSHLAPEVRQILIDLPTPPALEPGQEQLRLMSNLTQFIKYATRERPWLLIFDDLQWADESSLDMLRYLGHHIPSMSILIVGTYRDSELTTGHPLLATLRALNSYPTYHHFSLDRLRQTDVEQVLTHLWQQPVPAAFVARIYQHTEGNPFYVEEIAKGLVDDGLITMQAGKWRFPPLEEIRLPSSMQEAVWRRIGHLNPDTQALLCQAAVLGHIFAFDDLRELCNLPEWQVLEQLDMALERQLVIEVLAHHSPSALARNSNTPFEHRQNQGVPGETLLRFRHIEIQQVLYDDLGVLRRRILHRQAGEALERRAQPEPDRIAEKLAYHFEEAGEFAKAITYSVHAAGQAQAAYANESALGWYSRSLNMLAQLDPAQSPPFQPLQVTTHQAMGEVLILVSRYNEALEHLERARAQFESLPSSAVRPRQWASLCCQTAQAYGRLGKYDQALAWIENGLRSLDTSEPTIEEMRLHSLAGWIYRRQDNSALAQTRLEQALAMARAMSTMPAPSIKEPILYPIVHGQEPLRQVEADGLRTLGLVACDLGYYAQGQTRTEQALLIYREIGDRRGESMALNNLGIVLFDMGDYAAARSYFEHAMHIRREIGDRQGESAMLNNLGEVAMKLGDYTAASNYLERALLIKREVGDRWGEVLAIDNLGMLYDCLGQYASAQEYYEQSVCISREIGAQQGDVLTKQGLLYHHQDNNKTAREHSQQALLVAQELGNRSEQAEALVCLGHALAALQLVVEAAAAYRQAVGLWRELGQAHMAMDPLAGLAGLFLAQGNLSQAQAEMEEILSYLENHALAGVIEPFRVYLTCYRVLKASGDPRARDILNTAHGLLQEQAAKISDMTLRRSFLENVAAHRAIAREFAQGES